MNAAASSIGAKTCRVLVVDDHPTVCEGLSHRINAQADMSVCGVAADGKEAIENIPKVQPHLVIVDISLKNSNGLDLVKELAARHPGIRVLVHSMYDETIYADRCLRAGAQGYLNKESDPNEVINAIREIRGGNVYLSPSMTHRVLGRTFTQRATCMDPVESLTDRQLEIFRLLGEGKGARSIGERLHISVHTVETHRENIKRKLHIDNLAELTRTAVLWVQENG